MNDHDAAIARLTTQVEQLIETNKRIVQALDRLVVIETQNTARDAAIDANKKAVAELREEFSKLKEKAAWYMGVGAAIAAIAPAIAKKLGFL